jgi:hypothetical protein
MHSRVRPFVSGIRKKTNASITTKHTAKEKKNSSWKEESMEGEALATAN